MAEKELALCDECGSLFFKGSSQMMGLCPECAHILYGYPNCDHHFQDGRCVNCYWDGSKSVYIKKQNQQEETDMPTTEWLNKYESIKDKLTCKVDLEAHFTEKVIGNMAVDVLDIGTDHFPTGQIFACDPLVELEDTLPFLQTIPAGTYPVKICVVPSEKYGDRYACVKVEVSREKPVRYELGMVGNENLDAALGDDDYFGFGVDAGMGCIADIQTQAAFKTYWAKRLEEDPDIDPYNDLFCDLLEENAQAHPKYQGTAATGSTGPCRTRTATCPSSPLAGVTVTIPSTSAMMQRAKSAPCMCASLTLKPATRSRRKEENSNGMAKTGADGGLGKRRPDPG